MLNYDYTNYERATTLSIGNIRKSLKTFDTRFEELFWMPKYFDQKLINRIDLQTQFQKNVEVVTTIPGL